MGIKLSFSKGNKVAASSEKEGSTYGETGGEKVGEEGTPVRSRCKFAPLFLRLFFSFPFRYHPPLLFLYVFFPVSFFFPDSRRGLHTLIRKKFFLISPR